MRFLIHKDFLAGLMFVAFGALGIALGAEYRMGTAARMGPGYLPRLLSWVLVALGAVIMLRGILGEHEAVERGRWRPLLLITLAIVVFALLIDPMGLLAAGAALIVVGAVAGPAFSWRETLAATVVLLAISAAVFVWGLQLPITLLPRQ
jgi:putative tricarboxylic transport membrane protein